MQSSEGQQAAPPNYPQHPDSHYQPLKDAIPAWLGRVAPGRLVALKATQPLLPLKLQAVEAGQHQAFKALTAEHWIAQSAVDEQLEHLQDASAFAEPLLKAELKRRFALDLDVRKTFLRLYVPATTPLFGINTGARTWTVSLLDAALHNFEDKETEANAFEADSTFITEPSSTGLFDTLPSVKATMSIAAFTRLCRELDIGARYKAHLENHLGFSDPAVATALRQKIDNSEKASMKAALQWAQMNGHIGASHFRLVSALLNGFSHLRSEGYAWLCHELTMMSAPLTGILVFIPDPEKARKAKRVVAYVPDDPEHPFKEYASTIDMEIELTRQLRSPEYQRFFSRFVNHEQRGVFFAGLNERLSKITWYPHVDGSAEPTWRDTPIEKPDLQLEVRVIKDDPWQHLYQTRLNKILNDARVVAVPTASVDQKARWAFWDSVVDILSTILQTAALIVAPFVPVLGEAMMAYMAYQFLDDAFEGIIEWAQGRTREALGHLISTVESLIQLGAFAIGGNIAAVELTKVLPAEVIAFVSRFKPVKLADGQTRYWQPDLARYQQQSLPDVDSTPNALGLHHHQGKRLLPLEEAYFAVRESDIPGQYRIEHPTRADAYQPWLRHNGDGAWHTELEQPLEWDTATALRRLGPAVESFSAAERETLLQVSGVSENALRKMHVEQQSTPPLLADTLQRFKIEQQLQRFTEDLGSDVPEDYLRADPVMQLQLLSEHGRWPGDRRLRLMDRQGDLIWQSSTDDNVPLFDLHEGSLIGGDLLKTLFYFLDEPQAKALLGDAFGDPTPPLDVCSQRLREQLVQIARQQRGALFEARYQALQRSDEPLVQPIIAHDPSLPAAVTRELLATATGDELLAINDGQVPARQQQLMQLATQEVRITRAYEGLELDFVSNTDSATLALHSLKRLPGWSGDVRIEIRDGRYEGPLLDSTGRADAPAQKILVRRNDGTYQPFDDRGQELQGVGDFYSSILCALPDTERQALNIRIDQADALKTAIRQRPMARSELRLAMGNPSVQAPVVDTLRLLGADGVPRAAATPRSLEQEIQVLYPVISSEEAQYVARRLRINPIGPQAALARLHGDYLQLQNDLQIWANSPPAEHPATHVALTPVEKTAQIHNRRLLREELLSGWRRENGNFNAAMGIPTHHTVIFAHPILGDLPVLSGDFSHITKLTLEVGPAARGVEAFLEHFPGLNNVELRGLNVSSLPPAISNMPILTTLKINDCGLVLNADSQQALSTMSQLLHLDLSDNRQLGQLPRITDMPGLMTLKLSNTGISTLPAGMIGHPSLETAHFNDNHFEVLPEWLFDLDFDQAAGISFAGNPLSIATREQIKTFYDRTDTYFDVLADQADIDQVRDLYPSLDPEVATDLFYGLPGTLADARFELTRSRAELDQLLIELETWRANVPDHHPGTGAALSSLEKIAEQLRRHEFRQKLEACWRQTPNDNPLVDNYAFAANMPIMGELPTLTARLRHVPELNLMSQSNFATTAGRFLESFPNLKKLTIRGYRLGDLPDAVFTLQRLTELKLPDCAITLSPENAIGLSGMDNLEILDLRDNPLGLTPDLSNMEALTQVNLSRTGIDVFPPDLLSMDNWTDLDLSHNAISEIPAELEQVDSSNVMDFSGNPFTQQSLDRITLYFLRTGNNLGLDEDLL